jgi:hypothetical protein
MKIKIREVSDVELVFPTNVDKFLPSAIPDYENKDFWEGFTQSVFSSGLKEKLVPKEGIDAGKALRHIKVCLGSWEPKHEHKIAGVAYLFSSWFEGIETKKNDEQRADSGLSSERLSE